MVVGSIVGVWVGTGTGVVLDGALVLVTENVMVAVWIDTSVTLVGMTGRLLVTSILGVVCGIEPQAVTNNMTTKKWK